MFIESVVFVLTVSITAEEISKVVQDLLSVLPLYDISRIDFLSGNSNKRSIPFCFKLPVSGEYKCDFNTFISNLEERLEYTGEYNSVRFGALSEYFGIPEKFKEQICNSFSLDPLAIISDGTQFVVHIIQIPQFAHQWHPVYICMFPVNGTVYGSIVGSSMTLLGYNSENIIRDLAISPYKLSITTDIKSTNKCSDDYSHMYTGILSERAHHVN